MVERNITKNEERKRIVSDLMLEDIILSINKLCPEDISALLTLNLKLPEIMSLPGILKMIIMWSGALLCIELERVGIIEEQDLTDEEYKDIVKKLEDRINANVDDES